MGYKKGLIVVCGYCWYCWEILRFSSYSIHVLLSFVWRSCEKNLGRKEKCKNTFRLKFYFGGLWQWCEMFSWTCRNSRHLQTRRFEEHKGIIFWKLYVDILSCVSIFNGYVWQKLLRVGETQCVSEFGTQQARAPLLAAERKRSVWSRRLKVTKRVSLWCQEATLNRHAQIACPDRGLLEKYYLCILFIFWLSYWLFFKFLLNVFFFVSHHQNEIAYNLSEMTTESNIQTHAFISHSVNFINYIMRQNNNKQTSTQTCPVGWYCRIHRLLLYREVRPPPNEYHGYGTKNLMVRFQ